MAAAGAASRPKRSRALIVFALILAPPAALGQACTDAFGTNAVLDGGADSAESQRVDVEVPPAPRTREKLSGTGLFKDITKKTLADDARAFQPTFALWSDAAEKKRWIRLPAGSTIDTSDPDHWVLPVGTQLFKEFSREGKRLETRLIERIADTGKDDTDYWLGAFLWRDDESDADFVEAGALDVRGTTHDVPSAEACWSCHIGEPGHALGFSALQLSHELGDLNLAELRAEGFVPPTLADKTVPGDSVTRDGVGYLHANCGHCHNQNGASWPDTDMVLRFGYDETSVASSSLFTSTVGVATKSFKNPNFKVRIEPGAPDLSAVVHRMGERGDAGAMPPIATEVVDPAGVARVRTWIASLPPRDAGAD